MLYNISLCYTDVASIYIVICVCFYRLRNLFKKQILTAKKIKIANKLYI